MVQITTPCNIDDATFVRLPDCYSKGRCSGIVFIVAARLPAITKLEPLRICCFESVL